MADSAQTKERAPGGEPRGHSNAQHGDESGTTSLANLSDNSEPTLRDYDDNAAARQHEILEAAKRQVEASVSFESAMGREPAGIPDGPSDADLLGIEEAYARSGEHERSLVLTPASSIKPRRVKWMWDGRIALGTLALLAGREGLGKSTLAYWLAAQVTRGELPGEFYGKPRSVLVCATEDSWEHTIVPRLIAAGADGDRVFRVEVLNADEIHVGLSLPRDNQRTEQAARQTGASLLILDPIISRLGDLDTHRDSEVRQALEPLVSVAGRTGMAVLGLIHHNKSGTSDPLQLVMGSKAFTAVARSVHTVVPDPDDDTDRLRLFGTPKNNLGRSNLPTLAFTVESHAVPTDEGPAWTGRVEWHGEHDGSIADAMRRAQQDGGEDRGAVHEASGWLEDFLASRGGSCDSATIKTEGRKAGHSESAIKRAKGKLRLDDRSSGFPRRTFWYFPGQSAHQSAQVPRGDGLTEPTEPTGLTEPQSAQSAQSVHARGRRDPTDEPTGGM
ncbi:AAA family ATPase [Sinomonas humi]|uniref:AAA family ATPase n=1 Tax=Sinomonas humi TaxID=1338436 RepID=UPI00068DE8C3|nr:AAA family ATPase [Sinomonas humi]